VCKCFALLPYLLGKYYLPITTITNATQTFIRKFIEKGNSQQSTRNNNLNIYKKQFSQSDIHTKCQ
jgi:hypothetical protein